MSNTKETEKVEVEASAEDQTEQINPIFDEIEEMTHSGALNVLIQAAGQAQSAGALTVRDSVMVAKAIDVISPGSI
jgi:uncharacterized protein YjgD (DUF1641 family)